MMSATSSSLIQMFICQRDFLTYMVSLFEAVIVSHIICERTITWSISLDQEPQVQEDEISLSSINTNQIFSESIFTMNIKYKEELEL